MARQASIDTAEQDQFRAMVARFLRDRNPMSRVRQLLEAAPRFDRVVWSGLGSELGVLGIHIPEDCGGSGFGPVELGIVLEEMGRHLYCGPYFPSAVMAGCALLEAGTEQARALLPALADGSVVGVLVLDALDAPDRVGAGLAADGQGRISGTAPLVLGADAADLWLVVAREGDGLALYRLEQRPEVQPLEALDPTRPLARVSCAAVAAERLAPLERQSLERLWTQWSVYLAHELVGAADALLHSTVEYMGVRVQFGRTIGSFQALKHRCADLLMEIELARALAREGARALAAGEDATVIAHMAKAMASDAAMSAARAGIQLRGGLGFTWENDTHFWFKRVKSAEVLFGTPAQHRESLMVHLEAQIDE